MVINAVDVCHMYKCVKTPDFGGMLPPFRVSFCKSSKNNWNLSVFPTDNFSPYVSGDFFAIFVVSVGVAVDGVPTKKEGGLASRLP